MPIKPDTKDWTWVLETPCADCGFHADAVDPERLGEAIRANAASWRDLLSVPGERVVSRPSDDVWSPLEYACHVRDVHRLFDERLAQVLAHDDPRFDSWDQDAAAVAADYGSQDPLRVAEELVAAARDVAATYDGVVREQWDRTGRRGDGFSFTVASLGRYHLHDVVHHLHDASDGGAGGGPDNGADPGGRR